MGQKKMLVLTMLCISLFQMGMVGLAPVVSAVVDAFPGTSALAAQMATTFLNLVLVGVALLSGTISRHFGRRKMCAGGMLLFALAGICGAFFTVGLWAVFVWSAFLGAGTGLFVPAVSSMMIDYLDDGERSAVAGLQTAFVNLGGMALSFLAGLLAGTVWSNAYLVFLAAVPVFFLCLCGLPREKAAPGKADRGWRSGKLPRAVWLAALQTFLFAVLYFAFSTNISLLLVERHVWNSHGHFYAGRLPVRLCVYQASGAMQRMDRLFGFCFAGGQLSGNLLLRRYCSIAGGRLCGGRQPQCHISVLFGHDRRPGRSDSFCHGILSHSLGRAKPRLLRLAYDSDQPI